MDRCIVYSRKSDGGVAICYPMDECIAWMTGGGGIWNDKPRGYFDTQVERMISSGRDPDAAFRFAKAVQFGGCTTAEALEIIRDRDCSHLGTAIELWEVSDIPSDRWFRNAWRRSHNGGPIYVNLELAKPIQFKRIKDAIKIENEKRGDDIGLFNDLISVDLFPYRQKIMSCRDEKELRAVWPVELRA